MTLKEMEIRLKNTLSPERFTHSLNVMNMAVELAIRYDTDKEQAAVAGLLHDCARRAGGDGIYELCRKFNIEIDNIMNMQPVLIHGLVGAELARVEYRVEDECVLKAIRNHTTGCDSMDILDKIIYLADYIEPGRICPGIHKIREKAFVDLDEAVIAAFDSTIGYVVQRGLLLHPRTISARNSLLMKKWDAGDG